MITDSIRSAWRFFYKHAGWATPPGKAVCALRLAKAEQKARDLGLNFNWEDDPDGWPEGGVCSCGCGRKIEMCEGCVVRDEDGNHLASLWAIWDADTDYRRVVRAELACEALEQLEHDM